MEERLKERLTGAILLVVLVVVLVPAMFRGERPGTMSSTAAGGLAQQVYTIDLKGVTPAATESPAAATQPATLPAEVPAASEYVAPAAAQNSASAASVPAPEATVRPAPAAPPARIPTPATSRSPPSGSGFVVQVGSFSSRENADVMVRQAAKKGVRLTTAGPDDRGLFRVRSTVVRTRQEAVALQEKLRTQGYKGIVGAVN